jgi:hypothetical protein
VAIVFAEDELVLSDQGGNCRHGIQGNAMPFLVMRVQVMSSMCGTRPLQAFFERYE